MIIEFGQTLRKASKIQKEIEDCQRHMSDLYRQLREAKREEEKKWRALIDPILRRS
jgi:hypothetical protein